jgi:hypothetical protein
MSMSKITDILLAYASINDDELGEDKFGGHHDTKQAEQAILALIAEPLKDEEITRIDRITDADLPKEARNQLRAEIRERLGLS